MYPASRIQGIIGTSRHPQRRIASTCTWIAVLTALGGCIFDSEPENHPPVIRSLTAEPATALPDSVVTVSAQATDSDGDPLRFLWAATSGSFPEGTEGDRVAWRAPGLAGVFTLTVVVTDGQDPVRDSLEVRVVEADPVLAVTPRSLDFSTTSTELTLEISNAGTAPLLWTAGDDAAWLAADPTGGTTTTATDVITVTVDRSTLAPGSYAGSLWIDSNGGADTVAVAMEVATRQLLAVDPPALDFGTSRIELDLAIVNAGTGVLTWSVGADDSWLRLDPRAGSTTTETDTVAVVVDRSGLAPDSYTGTVRVSSDGGSAVLPVSMVVAEAPVYTYEVIHVYPHDPFAFTQGLVFENGALYEGTGGYGRSTLRRVDLDTGKVLQSHDLAEEFFGEGITIQGGRIIQLTWRSNVGFVYDVSSFGVLGQFGYSTEGWGITHDGERLIMSDGTSTLFFLDLDTFRRLGTVQVTDHGNPVTELNELEYVQGEIYANVWRTDRIARIAPETGEVVGWIDLEGLLGLRQDVLNGIAYDSANDRLFVTGKLWPSLFEIELVPGR